MIFNIGVIVPFVAPAKFLSIALSSLLLLVFVSAWLLLQRGFMRHASLVYVGGMWLVVTFVIVVSSTIHSAALLLYVALPISAAWLLGYRAALWFAALCLLYTLAMVLLDFAGIRLPSYFVNKPLAVLSDVLYATVIATVPAAQVLKNLKEALAASQRDLIERIRAETELRKHQEHLEELVEQRTAQLVESRNQAEAANRAKSIFLANMSHELRTPLNAILGFSNLLRDREGISEEQCQDLDIINRSGEHLLELINDVLDMAKIEAGRVVVENAPCDLRALVREVTGMMQWRAGAKKLQLLVEASPDFPQFGHIDASKLRQILINLLGNAVVYTEQGTVTLRLDGVVLDQSSNRVLLRMNVEDTGVGIAAEDQARIFEPFVQVGRHGNQRGTGLGLSIVRKFVELMGGTFSVESRLGQGSRFCVELPVERVKETESVPPGADRSRVVGIAPGQPEFRILVVDDGSENRLLMRRLLERAGFRVDVAEDGEKGIEIYQSWRPHFIWVDRGLPGIDGLETVRRIRELEGGKEVKIAGISASVLASEQHEILAAGTDDFVGKPFRTVEIFDCMARHLGVRYSYQTVHAEEITGGLEQEQMAALPAELRMELADAVISLDTGLISLAITHISEKNAALGSALSQFAERYAYSSIFQALRSSEAVRT